MCTDCDIAYDLEDEDDFLDDDEEDTTGFGPGWKLMGYTTDDGMVYATGGAIPGSVINPEPRVLPEDKIEFTSLLFAGDERATAVVQDFFTAYREPEIVEIHHTLWVKGQRDQNGMYVYHVTHNLNTVLVDVELDSEERFTYSVLNDNTVVVVCPESLFGVDVTVKLQDI